MSDMKKIRNERQSDRTAQNANVELATLEELRHIADALEGIRIDVLGLSNVLARVLTKS